MQAHSQDKNKIHVLAST